MQEEYNTLLSRAIYASGTPLQIVENQYWQAFFTRLRPAWKIPTRAAVSTRYMEREYASIQKSVNTKVHEAMSIGLMCDGWTNIRRQSIVNFVLTTPEPVFYKTFPTLDTAHDATYIAKCISEVVEEVGSNKIFGIVTDNAANMKAAWTLIRFKYQHIYPYGCVAHGLNLLAQDIIKLPVFDDILTSGKEIVKEILYSHKLNAILNEKQVQNKKEISLKLPVATRWGTHAIFINSLLANKSSLEELSIDKRVNRLDGTVAKGKKTLLTAETKQKLLDDDFWDNITCVGSLLQPILKWITIIESDKPQISLVCQIFHDLKTSFESALQSPPVALELIDASIFQHLSKRNQFCITNLHKAASLLDPKQRGQNLTQSEIMDGIEFIAQVASESPEVDEATVLAEFAGYRSKEGAWGRNFIWKAVDKVSAEAWWKGISPATNLITIACKILNSPATSAACERTFSTYGHVHNKRRNRLTNDRAGKLVFIKHNLKLLEMNDKPAASKQIIPVQEADESDENVEDHDANLMELTLPVLDQAVDGDIASPEPVINLSEDDILTPALDPETESEYGDEEWLLDDDDDDDDTEDQEWDEDED